MHRNYYARPQRLSSFWYLGSLHPDPCQWMKVTRSSPSVPYIYTYTIIALLIPQAFDLSVCSALRVLQFTGPISDTLEVRLSQWAFLCTLLQQIPPHTSPKFQLQINYSLNGVSRKKVEDAIEDLGRLPVPPAQLGELLRRPTIVYIRFRDVGSEVGRLQSGSLWRAFSVKFPSLVEEGRLKSITG